MAALYAIGLGGWVEIRKAEKPPIASTSSTSFKVTRKVIHGVDPIYFRNLYKDVVIDVPLNITTYKGGKVLGCLSALNFNRLTATILYKNDLLLLNEGVSRNVEEHLKKGMA